jgi:lipopolysaccharide export system permease protein
MIWLYIKELAGKDLDLDTVIKFITYGLPKLIPLVLPLTILLTSIMVFGSFAENYEFAAMKSTGISLQRAMAGLSVFIVALAFVTFWFSNNVIPWGEFNFYNLRKNLAKVKPSMAIAKGQFNEIDSTPYNIKVEDKSGDKGQYLHNVIIHKKGGNEGKKNVTTIMAKRGELVSSETSDILKLVLFDGNFYEDVHKSGTTNHAEGKKHPFAKSTFKSYTMNIDLSNLNKVDIDDKSYSSKSSMLNISELDYTIDSLTVQYDTITNKFSKLLLKRSGTVKEAELDKTPNPLKKEALKKPSSKLKVAESAKDSLTTKTKSKDSLTTKIKDTTTAIVTPYRDDILELFDDEKKQQIINNTYNAVNGIDQLIINKTSRLEIRRKLYSRHVIKFHEKLALPFACIILFFVGAPLGALIRKGGLGLPMVIAILLFLTYHFIGIFALNSAKNGGFDPILASWFSTLIMFPLSVFLTRRATADRGIFDFDGIIIPIKRFLRIKDKEKENFKYLNSFTNDKLVAIVNSNDTLDYSEAARYEALKLLNTRGSSIKELRTQGKIAIANGFETSQDHHKNYKDYTIFTYVLYTVAVAFLVFYFILANNKLPLFAKAFIQLSGVAFILYSIYFAKTFSAVKQFYKNLTPKLKPLPVFLVIVAFPLYFILHFVFRKKLKKDLKQNCLDSLK